MSEDFIREAQAAYQADGDPELAGLLMKKQGQYTVGDYYALPEDCRVELIDGVIYDLASPSYIHQSIVMEIGSCLHDFIRNHKGTCMVFTAPTDVQLDKDDKTMVQPDVFVICRKKGEKQSPVQTRAFQGAPDLAVEVLSPSGSKKDRIIKYRKYKNAGVKEYWLVDPRAELVTVHWFGEGTGTAVYTYQDEIPVRIFDGKCRISLKGIAADKRLMADMGIE